MPLRIYGRRPLTRLEAGLYAAIAAVLIATFAERLLHHIDLAERAAVEVTLNQAMSAANTQLAYDLMRGRVPDPDAWVRRNPFELARAAPGNFSGAIDSSQARDLARGTWAFDRERAELIYRPRLGLGLRTSDPNGELRFRASIGGGALYQLTPVTPYRWE